MKRVLRILDSSVHVHARTPCRRGAEWPRWRRQPWRLSAFLEDTKLVARHDGDLRERRPRGFQHLVHQHVVMSGLRRDATSTGLLAHLQ